MAVPNDFNIAATQNYDGSYRSLLVRIKFTQLQPIADSFARNLDRVSCFWGLPVDVAHWAMRIGVFITENFKYDARQLPLSEGIKEAGGKLNSRARLRRCLV